jgi:glucose-1-phosphate thymidylyltransferase
MNGILLAGGLGTRLKPITNYLSKHLLPIGRYPMIYYPLNTFKQLGIKDITIILGGNSVGEIVNLLKDGSDFDMSFTYKFQKEPLGIAHAISLADYQEEVITLLGDNLFANDLRFLKDKFKGYKCGACVLETPHPERFGVLNAKRNRIIEKPVDPPTNNIIPGLYYFECLDEIKWVIKTELKMSNRNQYEITDILNKYLKMGMCKLIDLDHQTFWSDCGTFESIETANELLNVIKVKDFWSLKC